MYCFYVLNKGFSGPKTCNLTSFWAPQGPPPCPIHKNDTFKNDMYCFYVLKKGAPV